MRQFWFDQARASHLHLTSLFATPNDGQNRLKRTMSETAHHVMLGLTSILSSTWAAISVVPMAVGRDCEVLCQREL